MQRNPKQVYFWIWVVIFFHIGIVWLFEATLLQAHQLPSIHHCSLEGLAFAASLWGRHTAARHTGRLHRVHKRAEPFPNLWSLSPLKVDLIFAWEVLESFPKIKRTREPQPPPPNKPKPKRELNVVYLTFNALVGELCPKIRSIY